VEHPEFGLVEVGGWHRKFWGQNPPAEYLEVECAAQVPWIFYLMRQAPRLSLEEPEIASLGGGLFRVRATVVNAGFLPTSVTGRGAVGQESSDGSIRNPVVRPPVAFLATDGVQVAEGSSRIELRHLRGTGPFLSGVGPASVTLEWSVRLQGPAGRIRITARSDKAGTVHSDWIEIR
jgi:hypothetical protein